MKSLLLAGCLFLSACANDPVEFVNSTPSHRVYAFQGFGESTLRVIRDSGFHGAAFDALVLIDGQPAADLDQGESAVFKLPAGDHVVSVKLTGSPVAAASFSLAAGKTTTARVSTGPAVGIYPTTLNE